MEPPPAPANTGIGSARPCFLRTWTTTDRRAASVSASPVAAVANANSARAVRMRRECMFRAKRGTLKEGSVCVFFARSLFPTHTETLCLTFPRNHAATATTPTL